MYTIKKRCFKPIVCSIIFKVKGVNLWSIDIIILQTLQFQVTGTSKTAVDWKL